jgi:3-oxoacyl-[acyl-carrier-protein] synthase II
LEAIITVMALRNDVLPPTLNLTDPDEAATGLDLVGPKARHHPVEFALSNGFGFGGVNASLIFKRFPQS